MTCKAKSMILFSTLGSFWFFFITTHYIFGNVNMSFLKYVHRYILSYNNATTFAALIASIVSLSVMYLGYQFYANRKLDFLNEILDRSNDVIFGIDVESGLITYANDQVSSNLGVALHEIPTKKF